MENFLFPVIKVKVIKVIKGFGGNGNRVGGKCYS